MVVLSSSFYSGIRDKKRDDPSVSGAGYSGNVLISFSLDREVNDLSLLNIP